MMPWIRWTTGAVLAALAVACSGHSDEEHGPRDRWAAGDAPRELCGVHTWRVTGTDGDTDLTGLDDEEIVRVHARLRRDANGSFSVHVDVPVEWRLDFVPGELPKISDPIAPDVALALAASALDAPASAALPSVSTSSLSPLEERSGEPLVAPAGCLLEGSSKLGTDSPAHEGTVERTFTVLEESSSCKTTSGDAKGCADAVTQAGCKGSDAPRPLLEGVAADAKNKLLRGSPTDPVPREKIPDAHAFKSWNDDKTAMSEPSVLEAKRVPLLCGDKRLYPTHPQSSLKRYHRYAHGRYDHHQLTASSEACKLPSNGVNKQGQRRCAAAGGLDYAMLSDTYTDACGNEYRGFWDELYLTHHESMGTLVSKGRTVYPVAGSGANSTGAVEVYEGPTYAVDANEFEFLSPLLADDGALIEAAKTRAGGTHRYDPEKGTFEYVGPNR